MKEKLKNLTPHYGLYDYWKQKVSTLEKKDKTFIVMDLDDTIFSVQDRIDSHEMFKNNRAEKGNLLIANQLGIQEVCDTHYKDKIFPKNIIEKHSPENSLILTAGIREYQEEKMSLMGIDKYPTIVTPTGEDKIIALIRYVLFDLRYIPSKITVYEDRPKYFIEYRDLIEDTLGCELEIMYVEMDGNMGYKKIEAI